MKKWMQSRKLWVSVAVAAGGVLVLDYLLALVFSMIPVILQGMKHLGNANEMREQLLSQYLLNPVRVLREAWDVRLYRNAQWLALVAFGYLTYKEMQKRKEHKAEDASDYAAFGSSRWATKHEILDPTHFATNIEGEGTILAQYENKPLIQHQESNYNRNVCVFGGSGAGKTQSYILSNILNTQTKSVIAIDPKGEHYELTSRLKRQQGYDIHVMNFANMDVSDRYNPLQAIRKDIDAQRVASTLVLNSQGNNKGGGDPFWSKAEEALISTAILYCMHVLPKEQRHIGSVYNLITQAGADPAKMDALFESLPVGHVVRDAYGPIKLLEDKVRSSVFVSAAVTLNAWKYEAVRAFTATSDLPLRGIGQKKKMVYLILPVADPTWRGLISCFLDQVFQELYELADSNNNRLPVPVRILCDELANIGKVPNLAERLSTCRSYGIECSLVLQSFGQLKDRYGAEQADELVGNCDFKLFLNTTAYETAQYFSHMCGLTTVRIQNESQSKGNRSSSESESLQYTQRPLRTPDELMRLNEKTSECILLVRGKYPFNVRKAWVNEVFPDVALERVNRNEYEFPVRKPYEIYQYAGTKEVPEEEFSYEDAETLII